MTKPSYDKALDLLARRPHFHRELEAKLAARGYPVEEVAETLGRLAQRGFVDDRATARGLVAARLERGGVGRRRLAAELARKGVESELAEEVLAELVPDDDLPQARRAAERWATGRSSARRKPAALARHLERKGFSPRAIVTVLEELGPRDEE